MHLHSGGPESTGEKPFGEFGVRATLAHPGLDVFELHREESTKLAVESDGEAVVAVEILREQAGLPEADLVEHPAQVVQAAGSFIVG